MTVCAPGRELEDVADWAVLDGYDLDRQDEEPVRKAGRHLLVIDDHGVGGDRDADLVLDQNLDATAAPYEVDALLGTRYALLRREFRRHDWTREIPNHAQRLLVALGGSPPDATRLLIRRTLEHRSLRDLTVTVLEGVDDVASAMAGADMALSASGMTCWELCRMGLPAIVLPIAVNQEPLAIAMHRNHVADYPGLPATLTPDGLAATVANLARDVRRRTEMASRGPRLVDGRGAQRVVARMRSDLLELRPVREGDARLLWEWANDPAVRASSFNSEHIDWDTHVGWLAGRLSDRDVHHYLASHSDGTPLGQVRFEGGRAEVYVSVSVAPSFRGHGWGAALIDASVRRLFAVSRVRRVIAEIKAEHRASLSAFESAAFIRDAAATGDRIRFIREIRETRQDGEVDRCPGS